MVRNVKKQRPTNLDLQTIWFPIMAIAPILHRVFGVITSAAVRTLFWLPGASLSSPEDFLMVALIMDSFSVKFTIWGVLTAPAYHVVIGARYLTMDFGHLDKTFGVGKRPAKASFVITVVLSLLAGALVW